MSKVVIITGAARGIGCATSERFLKEGYCVFMTDIDSLELSKVVDNYVTSGLDAHALSLDITQADEIDCAVQKIIDRRGRIDILVNIAGGSAGSHMNIEDVTEEEYDRIMALNIRGPFFCIKAAIPYLKKVQGCIVNTSSLSGRMGSKIWSPQYSTAKGAVISLTRNLANQLGPDGVRVNAVVPGFIDSGERVSSIWNSRDNSIILDKIALGRRGYPDEIADAVFFLSEKSARYITGVILDVDGGYISA